MISCWPMVAIAGVPERCGASQVFSNVIFSKLLYNNSKIRNAGKLGSMTS